MHVRQTNETKIFPNEDGYSPEYFISGGADGVDSIFLSNDLKAYREENNVKVKGFYTPTKNARADTGDNPIDFAHFPEMKAGQSPLAQGKNQVATDDELDAVTNPFHPDDGIPNFLNRMEGEWGWRDTEDATEADAIIGILSLNKAPNAHDGTKATLNIFRQGIYDYLGVERIWDVWADQTSDNLVFRRDVIPVSQYFFNINDDRKI